MQITYCAMAMEWPWTIQRCRSHGDGVDGLEKPNVLNRHQKPRERIFKLPQTGFACLLKLVVIENAKIYTLKVKGVVVRQDCTEHLNVTSTPNDIIDSFNSEQRGNMKMKKENQGGRLEFSKLVIIQLMHDVERTQIGNQCLTRHWIALSVQ